MIARFPPRLRAIFFATLQVATAITLRAELPPGSVDPTFVPDAVMIDHTDVYGFILLQKDDRIIVRGDFNWMNNAPLPSLLRLNRDGSIDPSFDGRKIGDVDRWAIDASDRLLISGHPYVESTSSSRFVRLNLDGSLDPTFNPQVVDDKWSVSEIVPQSDGKILVCLTYADTRSSINPRVVRLNANGSVDDTFVPPTFPNPAATLAVQSDGKVLVGMRRGYTAPAGPHPTLLVRLNKDGSNDPTFHGEIPEPPNGWAASVDSILVQPDGRILVRHAFRNVIRLLPDGSTDPSFQVSQHDGASLGLLQPDGKFWVTGLVRLNADGTRDLTLDASALGAFGISQQSNGRLISSGRFGAAPFLVRRLSLEGKVDPTFSIEGRPIRTGPGRITGAIMLPSGKTVIAGEFNRVGNATRIGLARLNHSGKVDLSFDAGERNINHTPRPLKVAPDGKLIVGFGTHIGRLLDNGSIDPAFLRTTVFGVRTVDFQPDGKILYGGGDGLVRLNADGSPDPGFLYVNEPYPDRVVDQVMSLPDGSFLTRNSSRLRHFYPNGLLEPSFTDAAAATVTVSSTMARQGDGKLLLSSVVRFREQRLYRLNADGTNDTTFTSRFTVAGLALDSTGIYAAYQSYFSAFDDIPSFTIYRLNFDGSPDPDFVAAYGSGFDDLLLQPDGNLIITGLSVSYRPRENIVRLIGKPPGRLANISTRAQVGTGDGVAIGGFIVTGSEPKKVVIRALGPSLAAAGLPSATVLSDPRLEVRDARGEVIGRNFNWRDSQEEEIRAMGLPPENRAESAIVMTLAPGSYTTVVSGTNEQTGIGLVEVYDLNPAANSTLANISTRAPVGTGDDLVIAGFVLYGHAASTIVVRGLGPSLGGAIPNFLSDPVLELRNQDGALTATNDDWQTGARAELQGSGLAPSSPLESAIHTVLPAGRYTALLRGKSATPQIGLIEAYRLP